MSDDTRQPEDQPSSGPTPTDAPPPVLPVAPSWGSPSGPATAPPPPAPSYGATPPPSSYGPAAPGSPSYLPPQYGAPSYPPPQYGQPYGALPGVSGWGAVPQAPKPGVVPLRPLGLGEILDGAVSYIRRDPKTVLGISAVVSLVVALVQFVALVVASGSIALSAGVTSATDPLASSLGSVTASGVQSLVSWVLGVVATGLLTVVMGQAVLGRRVTAAAAWQRTSRRIWALFGLTLLVSIVVGAIAGGGVLLAVLLGWGLWQVTPGLGVFVGVVAGGAAIAAAVWVNIRLLLAPVALMLESAGVTTSMRRSWALVRGAWWRTFGIYLLSGLLAAIVSSVLVIPFAVLGGVATLGATDTSSLPLGTSLATSLGTLLSSTVVLPFTSGVVSLLYIDRRIRREALDIELARAAGIPG
ncbi:MAG TPA: hypothetical protein VLV82_06655 [Candidatus Angelobacter sp.]|nr:hypothetical protein [Candidatus Angelobacter sp.]